MNSPARTPHQFLPRRFRGKNGLPIEIRRFPGDCPSFCLSENGTAHLAPAPTAPDAGRPLIDMYLAFQPRNSFQGLPPIKDEVCIRWVRDILATGIHLVALGGDNQPFVGHAALFPVNPRKCELLVVVCPQFQNLGIGTELVRSCVDLAADLGFQQIWLPVDATNVRARHIYRKCGFEYVSGKQGRELDMLCEVRSAHSPTIRDLHGPAPRIPAPCFTFPALPHIIAQR
jgi:RimJ/RimL family protein N-acetyltransferase